MALRKKLIEIPLGAVQTPGGQVSKGIDQSNDDILTSSPILSKAINVRFDKDNTLKKRNGFTGFSMSGLDAGTTIYSVDSAQNILFIQTSTGNYSWSISSNSWVKTTTAGPRLKSYNSKIISDGSGSTNYCDQTLGTSATGRTQIATAYIQSTFLRTGENTDVSPLTVIKIKVEDYETGDITFESNPIQTNDFPERIHIVNGGSDFYYVGYIATAGSFDDLKLFTVNVATKTVSSPVIFAAATSGDILLGNLSDENLVVFTGDKISKVNSSLAIMWSTPVPNGGLALDVISISSSTMLALYTDIASSTIHHVSPVDIATGALGTEQTFSHNTAVHGSSDLVYDQTKYWAVLSDLNPEVWEIDSTGAEVAYHGRAFDSYKTAKSFAHPTLNTLAIPVTCHPGSNGGDVDVAKFSNSSIIVPSSPIVYVPDKSNPGNFVSRARYGLDEITQVNSYETYKAATGLIPAFINNAKTLVKENKISILVSATTNQQDISWYYSLIDEEPETFLKSQVKRYEFITGPNPSRIVELGGLSYRVNGSLLCFDGNAEFESSIPWSPGTIVASNVTPDFSFVAIYTFVDAAGNIHRSSRTKSIPCYRDSGIFVAEPVLLDPVEFSGMNVAIEIYIAPDSASNGPWYFFGKLIPELDKATRTAYFWSGDTNGQSIGQKTPVSPTSIVYAGQTLYSTGNILESEPTPNFVSLTSYNGRLFAIDADKPWKIWYSKTHEDRVAAEFNSNLVISLPEATLTATSVFPVGNRLIIATKDELYWTGGTGPNNAGAGTNFPIAQLLSSDTGVVEDGSVIVGDFGVVFRGSAGFYLLSPDLRLKFIGKVIEDSLGTNTINSALLFPKKKECRWVLSDGTCLIWNYRLDAWTVYDGLLGFQNACVYNDEFVFIATGANFIYKEEEGVWSDDSETIDPTIVETSWIKFNTIQGYQRIRKVLLTGHHSSGDLTVYIANDYDDNPTETHTWTEAEMTALRNASGNFSVQVGVKNQKSEAIKLRIQTEDTVSRGYGAQVVSIVLEAAVKSGRYKNSEGNNK